ncbi:MAG: hypothetical protein ACE5FA_09725 [Dehalococcoidia bacterium]
MRLARILLPALALLAPSAARAIDLKFGVEAQAVYDTNVFRDSNGEKDDASVRLLPSIGILQESARLKTNIFYQPTYEAFVTYTEVNDLTHNLRGSVNYRLSDKTQTSLSHSFRLLNLLNFADEQTIDEGVDVIPDNDINRDRVLINSTVFQLDHVFTSRWSGNTNVRFQNFDSDRRQSVDSKTFSAFQSFLYGIDAANTVGVGGGVEVQMFDEVATLPASNTYVFNLFGTYQRKFGESTTLTVQAGPAVIYTDQDKGDGAGGEDEYPFVPVKNDTTVGDLRGQNVPIEDDFGQGLTNSTPVPAGSAVVPSSADCINGFVAPVLFEGSRCKFQRLLRNSAAFPDEQAPLPTIFSAMTPVNVVGGSGTTDTRVTIFGNVALSQRWSPTLFSSISYNRSQSTGSGQGASTIADSFSLLTTWLPSELWDVSLRANFVMRNSPTDLSRTFPQVQADGSLTTFDLVQLNGLATSIETSNAVDTKRVAVFVRAARRITRRVTVAMRAQYSKQVAANTGRNPNDFGDFTAVLGVRYDFDPYHL